MTSVLYDSLNSKTCSAFNTIVSLVQAEGEMTTVSVSHSQLAIQVLFMKTDGNSLKIFYVSHTDMTDAVKIFMHCCTRECHLW